MKLSLDGDRLPREAIRALQLQALHLLELEGRRSRPLRIGESFSLIEVSLADLDQCEGPPPFQGRWLHLVAAGSRRPIYLLSHPLGPTSRDWLLFAMVRADLGSRIRRALLWTKRNVDGRYSIGLVRVPSCRLVALLLKPASTREECRVVVAHAPTLPVLARKLECRSYADFVRILGDVPRVAGLAAPGSGRRRVTGGEPQRAAQSSESRPRSTSGSRRKKSPEGRK